MLRRRLPLLLAAFTVSAIVGALLIILLLNRADSENCLDQRADCVARVVALLANADTAAAPALLSEKACLACHNLPSLAPSLELARAFAPSRRPPLDAATYLYEALVYPNAHIVPGYNPTMPITPLDDAELGAILAYLLGEGG